MVVPEPLPHAEATEGWWLEDVPILGRHGVNYLQVSLEGRCVRNLSIAKSKSRNTSKNMQHERNCR